MSPGWCCSPSGRCAVTAHPVSLQANDAHHLSQQGAASVKNELLLQLWRLLLLATGFSLLSHHSRLLRCACIGHLLQAEEPRHLCNLVQLDEHLTLAMCQP